MLFQAVATLALLALTSQVQARSGGYGATCKDCVIGGGGAKFIACVCGDGRGGQSTPSIAVGSCFGNSNGHLVYQLK